MGGTFACFWNLQWNHYKNNNILSFIQLFLQILHQYYYKEYQQCFVPDTLDEYAIEIALEEGVGWSTEVKKVAEEISIT